MAKVMRESLKNQILSSSHGFHSSLPAFLPTEEEAIRSILLAWTPAAIPKWTPKRTGKKVPNGAAQFDPVSKEWKEILEEREDKTPKKKGGISNSLKR